MVLAPMVLCSPFMKKSQVSRSAQLCRPCTRCIMQSNIAVWTLHPPAVWTRWQAVLMRETRPPFWNSSDTTLTTSTETSYMFQRVYAWSHLCLSCKPARSSSSNFTRQSPRSSHHPCPSRATSIIFSRRYPCHLLGGHWNFMEFMNLSSARGLGPMNSLFLTTLFERPVSSWD